jgi:hypothetical protein
MVDYAGVGAPEWIRTTGLLLRRHCGQAHLIDSTDRCATVQSFLRLPAGEIASEIAGEVPQWFSLTFLAPMVLTVRAFTRASSK